MEEKEEARCGTCWWWETEEGEPRYCIMKDLYTETEAEHECDETDIRGNLYYEKKEGGEV